MKNLVEQHAFDYSGLENIEINNDLICNYTEKFLAK